MTSVVYVAHLVFRYFDHAKTVMTVPLLTYPLPICPPQEYNSLLEHYRIDINIQ